MGNNYGPRRVEIIQPFYFSKTRAPFIMRATFLITPTAYCWFKREASVAGVNVVSLMPIRRGCASVNRVNRVQGNQCARETRPVAERTHTHAAPAPFYLLSAALKLARPRQYGKLAQFSNRCCFSSPLLFIDSLPYMHVRSRVEIRAEGFVKNCCFPWKKTLSYNSTDRGEKRFLPVCSASRTIRLNHVEIILTWTSSFNATLLFFAVILAWIFHGKEELAVFDIKFFRSKDLFRNNALELSFSRLISSFFSFLFKENMKCWDIHVCIITNVFRVCK